ncbi:hypothetical protein TUN199_07033 [Pyrenophora tritici-repentis]|uniref:Uncharacterized protein n=2 Tax=Pyrenophora tritici-repentis TaxID=45151 RepID=A0A2W1EG80_9PLEO|nr:hypothetical protein Alg130_05617 [Pyrenophora tritici-repentis]KAI0610217.1 hypothetical protein TUN205_05509 [Pyrenophora tritici-repentis]KAI0620961.1 hypothetical protein TUN199_07033 [Pyrenophora tritici-repentis]KAI1516179.1 hypothetical protein Ptr86124_004716 [Pyrenophora tritici-repentis]PZD39146.1 Med3 domain containing protein [Pyrenophora tritici-repentis]
MSCNGCACPDTSTSTADGIGVSKANREAITGNVRYLLKTFHNCSGVLADPSFYLNKLQEIVEVVETAFVRVTPCEEVLLQLRELLSTGFPQPAAHAKNGPAAVPRCGGPPIVDRGQPPSIRFTVEQTDWEQVNKHENTQIKTMLGDLVFFEDEEKRKAVLNATEKANGIQALKSRLHLHSDVTVHQDIYEVKVFDVRFGHKMKANDLKSRVAAWSKDSSSSPHPVTKENQVTIQRAHYANNELRLELTDMDQAIQLVDQQFIVLDGKKYTDLRDWDRRWDRFQCYWCLGENHSAEWCRGRGAKPYCLWYAESHPSKECPVWDIVVKKNCIYCGENHCGTDNKCKHPTVVAELEKRGKMQARGTRWYRRRQVTDDEGFTFPLGRSSRRSVRRGKASAAAGAGATASTEAATAQAQAMDATGKSADPPLRQQTIFAYTVPKPPNNKQAGTATSPRRPRTPASQPSTSRQPPAANKDGAFAKSIKDNSRTYENVLDAMESRLPPPGATESLPHNYTSVTNGSPSKKRKNNNWQGRGVASPPPGSHELVGLGPRLWPRSINTHIEASPSLTPPLGITPQLPSLGNVPRQSNFFGLSQHGSQQNPQQNPQQDPQQSSKMKPDLPEQFARENHRTHPLVTLPPATANGCSSSSGPSAPASFLRAPHAPQTDESRQSVTSVAPQTSQLTAFVEASAPPANMVFPSTSDTTHPAVSDQMIREIQLTHSKGFNDLEICRILSGHNEKCRDRIMQESGGAEDTEMSDEPDWHPCVATAMSDHGSEDTEPLRGELRGERDDDSEVDFEDDLLNPNGPEFHHVDGGFDYDATHQLNPTLASQ